MCSSYLIRHAAGNILVDSPRFAGPLVRRIEALGGIRAMFLTHRDDVADHQRFSDHLSWDPLNIRLRTGRATCWYDWDRQIASMAGLAQYRFDWVLHFLHIVERSSSHPSDFALQFGVFFRAKVSQS